MYRDSDIISLLQKIQEATIEEEVEEVPGTMLPQEDPDVETPDDIEDIEKEDLDKVDLSKKKDREDAVKEIPDKDLEMKPQELKKIKDGKLYLCNECCKTFESGEPICSFCKGKEVELIAEGYKKRRKRDGTGPHKDSAQRSVYGDRGRRKQAGDKCPKESEEGKVPADKDSEEIKIKKLTETVRELIGEVPGISVDDQKLLHWAIRSGAISDKFPNDEVIFDQLSYLADVEDVEALQDVESVDRADIHGYYLRYALLPKAKEAYAKQTRGRESKGEFKLKEAEDGYTAVARGLEKSDADKLATEKNGMVIKDEEDDSKFTVIVKDK